jgi:hypothetical protein
VNNVYKPNHGNKWSNSHVKENNKLKISNSNKQEYNEKVDYEADYKLAKKLYEEERIF